MNCEEFNQIINELADYQPMQATLRDEGVSHVALCAECAGNLANVRAVNSGLLVAVSAESETAPPRVKENLLAAFAEIQKAKTPPAKVVDISSRRSRGWYAFAAVAAAAVILLAVLIPIWKKASAPDSRPAPVDLKASVPEATPKPALEPEPAPGATDEKPRLALKSTTVKPRLSKPKRLLPVTPQTSETVAQNNNEYLPLTYLATATAMDSGTVVRVELSRSALASLGFPVNIDGTGMSVKAEVVLGDDGVARAIRLLQ